MPEKMVMDGRNLVPMKPEMRDRLKDKEEAAQKERERRQLEGHPEPVKTLNPSQQWTKAELLQFAEDNDIKGCTVKYNKTQLLEVISKKAKIDEIDEL